MCGRLVNRILTLAAVLVLALGLAGTASAAPAWQVFIHPELGFSITYPSGWTVPSAGAGILFLAVGPAAAGVSSVRLNVNVTAEPVPNGMSLEQYEAVNETNMRTLFHAYRRLRSDRTQLEGLPALVRYFTWRRADGVELYQMQLVAVSRPLGYVVTGTTAVASPRLQQEATLLRSIMLTFRPRR